MRHFLPFWFVFFLFGLLPVPIAAVLLARAATGGFPGLAALSAVLALIPAAILHSAVCRENKLNQMEERLRDVEDEVWRLRENIGK